MPFNPAALPAPDLVKIRGDASTAPTYQNSVYLSIASNATIYSARVNQTSFPKPGVTLVYDGGSGTLADALVDMTVLVSATNDPANAYFRGRIRSTPSSTVFYINETGADFSNDDYIFVIDDFDTHVKLARYSGEILIDWDEQFTGLSPLISDHQAVYADFIDGSNIVTLVLAPTVTPAANGETISTYLWDVNDGTITVGTTATNDITVTFPAGERYIHLTATDSAGNATTRHIKVFAHDTSSNAPVPLGFSDVSITCEVPLEVNSGASEGWNATVTAWAGVTSVLDRSLVAVWNEEQYNGSAANIVNNIALVGRLRSEDSTSNLPTGGQIDATTSFEIEGVLAQLGRIAAPSIELSNSTSSSTTTINIDTLTTWRGIWAILSEFSTFGSVFPLSFDSTADTFEVFSIVSQGGDILNAVSDIAQGFNAVFQMSPDGRCEVVRRVNMLPTASRSSIVTVADMTTEDIVSRMNLPVTYGFNVARVQADGGGFNSSAETATAYIAIAPPGAPEEPASEETLPRQFLTSDQSVSADETEMVQRAGDAFAAQNNLEVLTVGLNDGWHFLIPSVDQRYTWTLPAALNTRSIAYTSAEDWMLQSVEKTPSIVDGTYDVLATFVRETDGSDGAIVPLPTVDPGEFGFLTEFTEIDELTPITFDDIDIDFTIDDGGFEQTPDETAAGTHVPAGWEADCVGSAEWLDITKDLGGTKTVTSVTITYDATYAGGATLLNGLFYRSFSGGVWQQLDTGFTTTTGVGVSVTITIPEIVATDLRLVLYAGGTDCTGALTLTDFSYTTLEAAGIWSHTIDFTVTNGGFAVWPSSEWPGPPTGDGWGGIYSAGNGWIQTTVNTDGEEQNLATLKSPTFATTTFLSMEWEYDITVGSFGANSNSHPNWYTSGVVGGGSGFIATTGDGQVVSYTVQQSAEAVGLMLRSGTNPGSGSLVITRATFTGTGTNPFV